VFNHASSRILGRALVIAISSSAVVAFVATGVASAGEPGISQQCTDGNDFRFASHGECVSTLETFRSEDAHAVGLCEATFRLGRNFFVGEVPGGEDLHFDNIGQCVSTLRSLGI
jgi:hypothetical protein